MTVRVLVESPFAYRHDDLAERILGVLRHVTYAQEAMNDSLKRGRNPYASHLLFTQRGILNDDVPEERMRGIEAGLDWGRHANLSALYEDFGISSGMKYGIDNAIKAGRQIEYGNRLPGWEGVLEESPRATLVRLGLYSNEALDKIVELELLQPGLAITLNVRR